MTPLIEITSPQLPIYDIYFRSFMFMGVIDDSISNHQLGASPLVAPAKVKQQLRSEHVTFRHGMVAVWQRVYLEKLPIAKCIHAKMTMVGGGFEGFLKQIFVNPPESWENFGNFRWV